MGGRWAGRNQRSLQVVHCHEGATNASNCREKNMGVMKAWAVLCVALVLTGMGCLSTADQLNDRALNGRVTTEPMAMAMKSKVGAQDEKLSALKKTDADLKKEVSKIPILERNDEELKSKVAELKQADAALNSKLIHLEKVVSLQAAKDVRPKLFSNKLHKLMWQRKSLSDAKKGNGRHQRNRLKEILPKEKPKDKAKRSQRVLKRLKRLKRLIGREKRAISNSIRLNQFACIKKKDVKSLDDDDTIYGQNQKDICNGKDGYMQNGHKIYFPALDKSHFECIHNVSFCRLRMQCDCDQAVGHQSMTKKTAECICAHRCQTLKEKARIKIKTTEGALYQVDIVPNTDGRCGDFAYCLENYRGQLAKIVTKKMLSEELKEDEEDAKRRVPEKIRAAKRSLKMWKKMSRFCDADGGDRGNGGVGRRRRLLQRGGSGGC